MHVQVITAEGQNGATNRLRHLKELKAWFGESSRIIHAEAYAPDGLLKILEVRAANDFEILVLECNREQIEAVLLWQSETEEVAALENVLVHLVRKQNTSGVSRKKVVPRGCNPSTPTTQRRSTMQVNQSQGGTVKATTPRYDTIVIENSNRSSVVSIGKERP